MEHQTITFGEDDMKTETIPVGGETFCSTGVAVGFGASGDGFFSTAGSLNKNNTTIKTKKS